MRVSVAPAVVANREVPTVFEFRERFMTYSRTNNKPSTVHAKEWMLDVHLCLPKTSSARNQLSPQGLAWVPSAACGA